MNEIHEILSSVLGDEVATAIIEHRRVTVKKALTAYAAKLQVKEYLKTGDPVAAAEMQILRGWQAIKADWYFNELHKTQRQSSKRETIADVAREFIEGSNRDHRAPIGISQFGRH